MESEFERAAKMAAVNAVERRIQHDEQVRRTASRKRLVGSIASVLFGLAILGGIGWWLYKSDSTGVVRKFLADKFPDWFATVEPGAEDPFGDEVAMTENHAKRYDEVVAMFAAGELAPWNDAPKPLQLANAKKGAVYYILVPNGTVFELYSMTKAGKGFTVAELSPFRSPMAIDMATFKRQRKGKAYFISVRGRVFVSNTSNLERMEAIRRELISTEGRQK